MKLINTNLVDFNVIFMLNLPFVDQECGKLLFMRQWMSGSAKTHVPDMW